MGRACLAQREQLTQLQLTAVTCKHWPSVARLYTFSGDSRSLSLLKKNTPNLAILKMLVQSHFKSMDEPNKTHLGAIFGPQATSLHPLIYAFVSHLMSLTLPLFSYSDPFSYPCLYSQGPETGQRAGRVRKCASE